LVGKLNQESKVSLFPFSLFLILIVSFLIKNPFIVKPFLGHFGSYQSILGMIAYEFSQSNFSNFLYPNSLTLTAGQPSLEMIYYPFSSFVAALFWKVFGGNLDYWGIFQAMLFSAGSSFLIYQVALKIVPRKSFGLWSAFLFAFSPMSLIYGRMFMNESLAVLTMLGSLFFLLKYRERRRNAELIVAGVLFSLLLIFRLHFICLVPVYMILIWTCSRKKMNDLLIFILAMSFLTVLWFVHTYWVAVHYPNVHTSLFAQVAARPFPDPLLLNLEFYKVIVKEVFFRLWGPITFLFVIGAFFMKEVRKEAWLLTTFLFVACLVFMSPEKFFDHPFYFLPLLVPGILIAALCADCWAKRLFNGKMKIIFILLLVVIGNLLFYWRPAFTIPSDTQSFLKVAKYVRETTPTDSRVMVIHGNSAAFLYYARRYGVGFNLTTDRTELPKYFRSPKYTALSKEEFTKRNIAYRDTVSWFEYLRQTQGIDYLAVIPKGDLKKEMKLPGHLDKNYQLISPPQKNFAVYKVSK